MKQKDIDDISNNNNSNDSILNILQYPIGACITAPTSIELVDRLLYEKIKMGEAKSNYAPYIATMPQKCDTMPRFWSSRSDGEQCWDIVNRGDNGYLYEYYQNDYVVRRKAFGRGSGSTNYSKYNDSDIDWAYACIDSRSNFLPDMSYALTPVLDMINHDCRVDTRLVRRRRKNTSSTSSSSTSGTSSTDLLSMDIVLLDEDEEKEENKSNWMTQIFGNTNKNGWFGGGIGGNSDPDNDQEKEREICISYGDLTNLQTLSNYGFVTPNNPCNTESFQVNVIRQSSNPVTIRIQSSDNGSIVNDNNESAIRILRSYLATEEELQGIPREQRRLPPFLSERNEIEVYALIAGYLEEAIYDTTRHHGGNGGTADTDNTLLIIDRYLRERRKTLQLGLDKIKEKYPQIFG